VRERLNDRTPALLGFNDPFDLIGDVFGELAEHAPGIAPAADRDHAEVHVEL
jgi:hypothetical protein